MEWVSLPRSAESSRFVIASRLPGNPDHGRISKITGRKPTAPQLLRELLVLDVVYRLRHQDHPNLGEYQARFAAHACVIRSAFEAAGISVSSSEPPSPSTGKVSDPAVHDDVQPVEGFRAHECVDRTV